MTFDNRRSGGRLLDERLREKPKRGHRVAHHGHDPRPFAAQQRLHQRRGAARRLGSTRRGVLRREAIGHAARPCSVWMS